jgi:nicotinamide-nucleotide amidase
LIKSPNPTLALYAKTDGINIRITAKAAKEEEARAMIVLHEAEVKKILGDAIWGADEDTLEGIVGQVLAKKNMTLAVAESFSAASLTQILSHTPQSHRFFKGGFYTNSDDAKLSLGLVWGAGGKGEVAKGMASLAREKLGSRYAIGIEGQAPTSGMENSAKVFIAIVGPRPMSPVVRSYTGRLMQVPHRVAYAALYELKQILG